MEGKNQTSYLKFGEHLVCKLEYNNSQWVRMLKSFFFLKNQSLEKQNKFLPAIAAATGEADEAVAPFEAACESSPIIASSNANSPLRNNSSSFFSTSVDNLLFFIRIFFFKRSGDGSWTPGCN